MKRKTYCCDASTPTKMVVVGYPNSSVDNISADTHLCRPLFKRFVIPFVAPHAKQIMSNVTRTEMEVVSDGMEGRSMKKVVRMRPELYKKNGR